MAQIFDQKLTSIFWRIFYQNFSKKPVFVLKNLTDFLRKNSHIFCHFWISKKMPEIPGEFVWCFFKKWEEFFDFFAPFWSKFFENSQKCPKKLHQKFSEIFPKSQFLFWKFFRFFKKICEKTIIFLTIFSSRQESTFCLIFLIFSHFFREFFVFFQKIFVNFSCFFKKLAHKSI